MKNVKVGWVVGEENWAFKNIGSTCRKNMKRKRHSILNVGNEKDVDVMFLCSPSMLKRNLDKKQKTVLHLDSLRALGL